MVEPDRLAGRWVHSHEEDSEDELVFRSADSGYRFPPARGRTAFELRPDGSYVGTAPGPADVPEHTPGTWKLEEGSRLVLGKEAEADEVLEIESAEEGVLKVRRRSES